jgi:dipeptidyl-peptidase-4
MTKSGCSLLTAGLFSLAISQPFVLFAAGQHHDDQKPGQKAASSITAAQISLEPDVNEPADSVRWSPDGARVGWMRLVQPAATARGELAQRVIWATPASTESGLDPKTSQPTIIVPATKVTACLRGTDVPAPQKLDQDDRQENPNLLQDFAWSSDHSSLLLVGGQSIAWLNLATGVSRLLESGDQPVSDAGISPDGHTVSYIRDHTLWAIDVRSSTSHAHLFLRAARKDILEGEPDWPYRNELHLSRAYWWSPDSARVAYLETDDRAVTKYSLRASDGTSREITYPKPGGELPIVHVFVKSAAGEPVEMHLPALPDAGIKDAPKGSYLPRVTWLADGRHLGIERLDRRQHSLQLFLADAVTGQSKLILTEKDQYWINLSDDLRFLKDGKRLIWSSERTGFRHLYLYDTEGKQLAQLTHGDWEVTHLDAIDEANGRIYFTATKETPIERHLYQVSLNSTDQPDSQPIRITELPGTHQAFIAPGNDAFLDVYSSQTTPPQPTLRSLSAGATETSADKLGSGSPDLQPVEFLKVKLHMGLEVNAFLIRPAGFDPKKKYPVIVYMAGGPGEQLVRDAWGGATELWMQSMAQKGFLVFGMDHQGTSGRGHFWEEPLHLRLSAQELIDQRDGVAYLRTLPYVDNARMGVCGWGYAGYLVVHSMLDRPVAFRAGLAGSPVTDWHFYDAVFGERYLDNPVIYADGWDASTALEFAPFFKGTLMVAQGTDDEFVHLENTLTLQNKLLTAGKSADVFLLADRGHLLDEPSARLAVFNRMTDFFLKNL